MSLISSITGIRQLLFLLLWLYLCPSPVIADVKTLLEAWKTIPEEIREQIEGEEKCRIVKTGINYNIDTLQPVEEKSPVVGVFLGFATDHWMVNQQPVNPEIKYIETLQNKVYSEYSPAIQPDEKLPQYMDFLVTQLAFMWDGAPDKNRPDKILNTVEPLCFVYVSGDWLKLSLPESNGIIANKISFQKYFPIGCDDLFTAAWSLEQLLLENKCLQSEGLYLLKVYVPIINCDKQEIYCYVELSSTLLHTYKTETTETLSIDTPGTEWDFQTATIATSDPKQGDSLYTKESLKTELHSIYNQQPQPYSLLHPLPHTPPTKKFAQKIAVTDYDDSLFYTSHVFSSAQAKQEPDPPAHIVVMKKTDDPILPTIKLLQHLVDKTTVLPIVLTALPPFAMDIVKQGLYAHGIPGPVFAFRRSYWDELADEQVTSEHGFLGAIAFKTKMMQEFANISQIVATFGDQPGDFNAYYNAGVKPENIWMMSKEGLSRSSTLLFSTQPE